MFGNVTEAVLFLSIYPYNAESKLQLPGDLQIVVKGRNKEKQSSIKEKIYIYILICI